jgi:hypothetical protein
MLGSETLEVAIGVAVLFSFLSLFASSLRESIEAWVKERGKFVHDAIGELFSIAGKADTSAIREFYESIIISPSYRGKYGGRRRNLPSYIPSSDFASALIDLAHRQAERAGAVVTAANADWINKVTNSRLAELLRVAYRTAGDDPDRARQFLEQWFDSQMERVSGWYKRRTQVILLVIGFLSAVLLNVDAIAITQHLYRNDALRDLIVAHAQASRLQGVPGQERGASGKPAAVAGSSATMPANNGQSAAENATGTDAKPRAQSEDAFRSPRETLNELSGYGFPIGWTWVGSALTPAPQCALRGQIGGDCTIGWGNGLLILLGWIITTFAISLGAPFWFDLLNKFMVIRSTVKPFEKSQPEGSEDRQSKHSPELVIKTAPSGAAEPKD